MAAGVTSIATSTTYSASMISAPAEHSCTADDDTSMQLACSWSIYSRHHSVFGESMDQDPDTARGDREDSIIEMLPIISKQKKAMPRLRIPPFAFPRAQTAPGEPSTSKWTMDLPEEVAELALKLEVSSVDGGKWINATKPLAKLAAEDDLLVAQRTDSMDASAKIKRFEQISTAQHRSIGAMFAAMNVHKTSTDAVGKVTYHNMEQTSKVLTIVEKTQQASKSDIGIRADADLFRPINTEGPICRTWFMAL